MKKLTVFILIVCMLFTTTAHALETYKGYYAKTAIVTAIDPENTVYCTDCHRMEWVFQEDGWSVGDVCSLLMYDNGTEEEYDDIIVIVEYGGWLGLLE